ncbi:MAG: Ig-like domain-containing protein, partial [Acetivibrio ethanolgignens]
TTVETGRYKSEDTEIATVTSQGTVTALKPGEVKITITIANGATDTCTVKVIE